MYSTFRLPALVLAVLGHVASLSAAPYTQHFTSHVSVATPDVSYSHGVGNPTTVYASARKLSQPNVYRGIPYETKTKFRGYPKYKPSIPFPHDEAIHTNVLTLSPWSSNNMPGNMIQNVPVLPPSPYRVNSPDPESLWPDGLIVRPTVPVNIRHNIPNAWPKSTHKIDSFGDINPYEDLRYIDPYLLEGSDAVDAYAKIKSHGEWFFEEIPHYRSLLANQEQRRQNGLSTHRYGSIRPESPFLRA